MDRDWDIDLAAAAVVGGARAAVLSADPKPGPGEPTLAKVRRETERFRDVNVALAEGYVRDPPPCARRPG